MEMFYYSSLTIKNTLTLICGIYLLLDYIDRLSKAMQRAAQNFRLKNKGYALAYQIGNQL